jgi:hypothetical protein
MKVMPPIFFSETIITVVMKFAYVMGIYFTKLSLFFHKVFFIIETLFPLLCEMVYAGLTKLFAEALGALYARCVSACCHPQNGVLGIHPSGG